VQVNPHLLRRRALLVVLLGGEKVGAGKEIFVKSQTSAWHVADNICGVSEKSSVIH